MKTVINVFRRRSRVDRFPVVDRQSGGRRQARPDRRRQDVAAQISLQDEGLNEQTNKH